jgi:uncharacterized membrane protein YhaH (DUF805 family)
MWAVKAVILCGLIVLSVYLCGRIIGLDSRRLLDVFIDGIRLELNSPEGRRCLVIGVLFAAFLYVTVFMPDLAAYIARVIDPTSFGPPEYKQALPLCLFFAYCVLNVGMLGLLYKKK